jgi:hypothetical protein
MRPPLSFLDGRLFPGSNAPDAGCDHARADRRGGAQARVKTGPEKLAKHGYVVPAAGLVKPWRPLPWAASALLAQLVEHLHGKEGVDGSSPSEGFAKPPQMSGFLRLFVVRVGDVWSHRGRTAQLAAAFRR